MRGAGFGASPAPTRRTNFRELSDFVKNLTIAAQIIKGLVRREIGEARASVRAGHYSTFWISLSSKKMHKNKKFFCAKCWKIYKKMVIFHIFCEKLPNFIVSLVTFCEKVPKFYYFFGGLCSIKSSLNILLSKFICINLFSLTISTFS